MRVNVLDGLGPVGSRPVADEVERVEPGDGDRADSTAPGPGKASGLSPVFLAYVVGPVALVVLVVLLHFNLVAGSIWAYVGVIIGSALLALVVERWDDAPPGSIRLHARVALHVAATASVVYMSGWGPALGMAFAFSA